MPPKNNNQKPPEAMTWTKASWVLVPAFITDALRLFFELFWLLGPALAAVYCTSKVSDVVGSLGGLSAAVCTITAGAAGIAAAGPLAAIGVVMGIAVGLLGWMTVGTIILMSNSRIFKENAGHSLWFIGSLMVSEAPIIGAVPALTFTMWKLYRAQIKRDKEVWAAYEKAQAEEQKRAKQRQAAEIQHAQQVQQQQNEEQAAAATEQAEQAAQEKESIESEETIAAIPEKVPRRLVSVPDYTGTARTAANEDSVRKAA